MRSNAETRKRSKGLDFIAIREVGRYHARRVVPFSTLKSLPSPTTPKTPSIHPWRDALLAGLSVAAAISLGAYIVYARACEEKVEDLHRQVSQLCQKLSQPMIGVCCKLTRKPADTEHGNAVLRFSCDNSDEARRIYAFSLTEEDDQPILDSGRSGEKQVARSLPSEALEARAHFLRTSMRGPDAYFLHRRGMEATAFALLHQGNDFPLVDFFGLGKSSLRLVHGRSSSGISSNQA